MAVCHNRMSMRAARERRAREPYPDQRLHILLWVVLSLCRSQ